MFYIKRIVFCLFFISQAFSSSRAIWELNYIYERNSKIYPMRENLGLAIEILITGKVSENTTKRYPPDKLQELQRFSGLSNEQATTKDYQIVKNIFKNSIEEINVGFQKTGDKNFAVTTYEIIENHINIFNGQNKKYALELLKELVPVRRFNFNNKEILYEKPKTITDTLKESGLIDKNIKEEPFFKQSGATYYGNANPTSLYGQCRNMNAYSICSNSRGYCNEKCNKTRFLLPRCPWVAPYNPALGVNTIQFASYFSVNESVKKFFGKPIDYFGFVVQSIPFSSSGNYEIPSLKLHGLIFGEKAGNINQSKNVDVCVSKHENGKFGDFQEFKKLSVHVHNNVASPDNGHLTGILSIDYESMNAIKVIVNLENGNTAGYLIILSTDTIWCDYNGSEPVGNVKNYIYLYIKKILEHA